MKKKQIVPNGQRKKNVHDTCGLLNIFQLRWQHIAQCAVVEQKRKKELEVKRREKKNS